MSPRTMTTNMHVSVFPKAGDRFASRQELKNSVTLYNLEKNDFKLQIVVNIPSRIVYECKNAACVGKIDASVKIGKVNGRRSYKDQDIIVSSSTKCCCQRVNITFPSVGDKFESMKIIDQRLFCYSAEVGGVALKRGRCNGKIYRHVCSVDENCPGGLTVRPSPTVSKSGKRSDGPPFIVERSKLCRHTNPLLFPELSYVPIENRILYEQHSPLRGCRGVLISLNEQENMHVLYSMFLMAKRSNDKSWTPVSSESRHVKQMKFDEPGLNLPASLETFESHFMKNLHKSLVDIGYCQRRQGLTVYKTFLKTEETLLQKPHIDFNWNEISLASFRRRSKSLRKDVTWEHWVPMIAFFPLTRKGMSIELWHHRFEHSTARERDDEMGVLVEITYGQLLVIRADVVHAGVSVDDFEGNLHGHFYIYKDPGLIKTTQYRNDYTDGTDTELSEYYKHSLKLMK